MSRTISVREAASALGITPRAVTYRLEKGSLKGTLSKNEFGVPEWRIYPNKEIIAGLNTTSEPAATGPINFEPADVVDATVEPAQETETTEENEPRFRNEFQAIVEECVRPLVEEVKAQALALAEKDKIIAEQKAQLLLLPDLESQRAKLLQEIEEERRSAEIQFARAAEQEEAAKALEAENERLKRKADEAVLSLQKLQILEQQIEQLRLPWWRKWFAAAEK